jgi:hypothetical protein
MDIIVSKDEIIEYKKLKVISEITLSKEKIYLFENKYGCSVEEFKRKMETSEEKFEEWDDYIEWKAHSEFLKDLEKQLLELDNAKDIKIV